MPTIEKTFIDIIDNAKERYSRGTTDLQKGAARPARAQQICAALHNGQASDWIGTISELTTNGEGYAVVKIEIAQGISVATYNNSFSDSESHTLIVPDTPLYKTLLGLKPEMKVRFSGSFFNDRSDCVREKSLTMTGSMTDPEFLFRFTSVESVGNAAGTLSYGSRVGMEVTVVGLSGIGTSRAVIRVNHTRENAKAFCTEYANDQSDDCVDKTLRETLLNNEIEGNCETGWFTSLYRERLQFIGEAGKREEFGPKYIILRNGEVLDGSSASGYSYDLEQFEALCPNRAFGTD